MWRVLPTALLVACGRLGFGIAGDDSPSDGPVTDGPGSDSAGAALLAGSTTCQASPTMLALDRDANAGTTLLVAFFMREPANATLPTIAGGTSSWIPDVGISSVLANNRRHLSLFRAQVTAKIPAGTPLAITHPAAESSGAAVFVVPATVARPAGEPFVMQEGEGAFAAGHTTTGAATLCAVVHHNGGSATFDTYTPFFDLISDCSGEARQTAAIHLATGPTGTTECTGVLNNATFSWITVVLGYDRLVP